MSADRGSTAGGMAPCPWCHRYAWWRSVYGVVVCGRCHPPAVPGVVAEWLPVPAAAAGGDDDAPTAGEPIDAARPAPRRGWPYVLRPADTVERQRSRTAGGQSDVAENDFARNDDDEPD